jgi:CBS domain-containing protein
MHTIGQLAVRVRVLSPGDSVGRAAEAVRSSTVGAVPVVADGRLLGLMTASSLGSYLATLASDPGDQSTVEAVPLEQALALPEGLGANEALQFFHANGLERAAVLDRAGGLVGLISRAELAPAVCGRTKPPLIGGMATPFGVYLTGGGVRGGVGDLALMSTGVYMCVLTLAAAWLTERLLGPQGWLMSVAALGEWIARVPDSQNWLLGGLFALFFRLSWITGYHAAEHQVVHAMEAGDDLKPEVVLRKPRVHPRCGTNLVTAVLIMSFFWGQRWSLYGYEMLVAMLVTLVFWRRVGGWLQQYVTTRPASPNQIASGIAAGKQLMERYQKGYGGGGAFRRVWNMGLLQVMAGWALVTGVLWLLVRLGAPVPPELRL